MVHKLSLSWRVIALVVGLLGVLTLNAKTTRLRDIYGPESVLSLDEAQALVEKAEDAFYRAEYAVAFEAVQAAVKITNEKLGETNKDIVNILSLLGEPRAKAWREAQLSLLRSKDSSHPYFWAAFTLTGQWN